MISPDQVTALAPDAASFKAGKSLAVASQWSGLGCNGDMLWGLAKGSGNKPYQTQVSVADFATSCSCPSRKFPCKHALGLMFLAGSDLSLLNESDCPDWVSEWQAARLDREEKAAKKKSPTKTSSKKTAERTRQKRTARVDEGVDFLQDFLLDQIRQGIGQSGNQDPERWDNLARRLIDCQATGLARAVRHMSATINTSPEWETQLLHQMGSTYLLINSYRKRAKLNDELRAETEQRIGWTMSKEAVLEHRRLTDDWFVAFRTISSDDRLTSYSNWVYGPANKQWALLLSFSASGSAPPALWPVGSTVSTELAFYPGANAERALAVDEAASVNLDAETSAKPETIRQLLQRVATTLSENPWCDRYPCLINAQPTVIDNKPFVVDSEGQALPLHSTHQEHLLLASVCGGKPGLMAGEWDGRACRVHAMADNGSWFSLRNQHL